MNQDPASASPSAPSDEALVTLPARGFGMAFGAPSLWTWTKWNLIKVMLTNDRLYGVWDPWISRMLFSRNRGKVYFDIPVASIPVARLAHVALNLAVAITYRLGDQTKEITIEGAVPWHDQIRQLHDALQRRLTAR